MACDARRHVLEVVAGVDALQAAVVTRIARPHPRRQLRERDLPMDRLSRRRAPAHRDPPPGDAPPDGFPQRNNPLAPASRGNAKAAPQADRRPLRNWLRTQGKLGSRSAHGVREGRSRQLPDHRPNTARIWIRPPTPADLFNYGCCPRACSSPRLHPLLFYAQRLPLIEHSHLSRFSSVEPVQARLQRIDRLLRAVILWGQGIRLFCRHGIRCSAFLFRSRHNRPRLRVAFQNVRQTVLT